ncbi:hypothetical protein SH668x_002677 [Planctomicrobium sp. SH668]|uniref:hypothetical protein n=1 Tax=Planctomicrobium sp. SH668 TaxID=3448126 RepID=UPI003F5C1298
MQLNRRKMMALAIGSLATSLTGCKINTTTIIIENLTGTTLSLRASATIDGKTYVFEKLNIPSGRTASSKFIVNSNLGENIYFNITAVTQGGVVLPGPFQDLPVIIGQTNQFSFWEDTLKGKAG